MDDGGGDGGGGDAADADGGPVLTNCGGDATAIDLLTDPNHCGTCTNVCTYDGGANNVVATCSGGQCGSGCDVGWGDCNADAGDGCETPVMSVQQCGACGHVCGSKNSSGPQCVLKNGVYACQLNCTAGNASCDGNDSNGCETDLTTSNTNCGVCGYDCGAGTCVHGVCKLTAGAEDFTTDPQPANPLAVDANNVYWTNPTAGKIRYLVKGTASPLDLATNTTSRTIAVDKNFVYFLGSDRETYYRALKVSPFSVDNLGKGLGNGSPAAEAIALDSDGTTSATRVFSTWSANGPGLWGGDIVGQTSWAIAADTGVNPGARGLAFVNKTVYSFLYATNKITAADTSASPPAQPVGATFWSDPCGGSGVFGMAATSSALFFTCGAQLKALDLPGGTTLTTVAQPNAYATGLVVTSGSAVYVTVSTAIYKFGVSETNATGAGHQHVDASPFGMAIRAIAVDGKDLYFALDHDVFRTAL